MSTEEPLSWFCRSLPDSVVRFILACLIGLSVSSASAELEVHLLTIGPGASYWERFGHNAIIIDDTETGDSRSFNYGIFDFEQENFFLNFTLGKMLYQVASYPSRHDLEFYQGQDRTIRLQTLNLTQAEANELYSFLEWNRQPENSEYLYDYFHNNCSTRVRDALDQVLNGQLKTIFEQQMTPYSFRWHVGRLAQNEVSMFYAIDLGLGRENDQRLSRWQSFFLPTQLADALASNTLFDDAGQSRNIIREDRIIHQSNQLSEPQAPPEKRLPLTLGSLFLVLLIVLFDRPWRNKTIRPASQLWLLTCALIGLISVTIWALTLHIAGYQNELLMIFNPALLLLLISYWRKWQKMTLLLGLLSLILLVSAIGFKIFGLFIQPWDWFVLGFSPTFISIVILLRNSQGR